MVFSARFLVAKMPGIQSQIKQSYGHSTNPFFSLHSPSFSSLQSTTPPSSSSSSSGTSSKISPTILFTIVIVALIVFVSGLIHLLVRFLLKRTSSPSISQSNRHPSNQTSGSGSLFQRQLRQLFHLHDSGLDQASIDALPLFLYKEIMGLKEQFDCAVCLCEFLQQDKLRLLPLCGHAFHIDCIDTWLLSNSTCPLCRGTISTPDFFYVENPVDFDCSREEEEDDEEEGETTAQKTGEDEIVSEKRVFPVRLGKFKSTNGERETEEGETTSSKLDLDGRRCYSLGSFQYVVGNSNLEVALCRPDRSSNSSGGLVKGRASKNGNSTVGGDVEGKKINLRSKGESFSVSKIWLWSKKGSSDTHMVTPSANVRLPWIDRAQGR